MLISHWGVMRCVALPLKVCILRPGGQGVEIPLAEMLRKLVKHGILMDVYDAINEFMNIFEYSAHY